MVHHITAAGSLHTPSGDAFAFSSTSPDALIVDANAFLISESTGDGARLTGPWTATINGEVESFGRDGLLLLPNSLSDVANVTIGSTGDVFGGRYGLLFNEQAGKITNRGIISGGLYGINGTNAAGSGLVTIVNSGLIEGGGFYGLNLNLRTVTIVNSGTIRGGDTAIGSLGITHLTNSGKLLGEVTFGAEDDTFTDFKKIGHKIKNGTVSDVIDLGSGGDHFNGGANGETVRDDRGSDTYKLGGGNDTYLAAHSGVDDPDTVDGGKGSDTYDATGATLGVTVNLDTHSQIIYPANTAFGDDVGFADSVFGFENAIGGSNNDLLIGSGAVNTLSGAAGNDFLLGLGGRDILTGGTGSDTFIFGRLSDSGTAASTRDLITDFTTGAPGVGDIIDLSFIDAKTGGMDDDFSFIGYANFGHHKGELRYAFSGGNTIVAGDVDGDGKADFSIALKGHILLHALDFVL